MTKLITLLLSLLITVGASAQYTPKHHGTWSFTSLMVQPGIYTVHIQYQMEPHWHIFSQHQPENHTCQPTVFSFQYNPNIVITKIEELGFTKYYTFMSSKDGKEKKDVGYEDYIDFQMKVVVKNRGTGAIRGSMTFEMCNEDHEDDCTVETVDFQVGLN